MTPIYKAVCKKFPKKYSFKKSAKVFTLAALFFIALLGNTSYLQAQCVAIPSNSGGSVSQNDINCKGTNSGSLILTTYVNSTAFYPFAWEWRSGSAAGPILTSGTATGHLAAVVNGGIYNLSPGTYVLVTCNSASQQYRTQSFTIIEPANDFLVDTTFTNPTCNNAQDGKAVVTASGGVPPYAYFWSTGDIDDTVDTLRAGINYTVDVTDQNSCVITYNFTLSNPTPVTGITTSTPSCTGATNGTASVAPSGGSGAGYTYLWAPGGQITQTATGLAAGNYTVVITDGAGCPSAPIPVTIGTVPNPTATITSTIQATCGANDGSAVADGSGGTGLYTYSWNPPAGDNDSIANNLGFGTYIVTVTDANLCTDTASAYISVSNPPVVTASSTAPANTICNGSSTILTASSTHGGTTTYVWSGGTIGGINTASVSVSPNATTTYTVIGSDPSPGCADTATITITVNTVPVAAIAPPAQTVCVNTQVTLTANSTVGGSTYIWTRSTDGSTVTNNPITPTPLVTTIYSVRAIANACTSAVVNSTVTVNSLPAITINPPAPTICAGGNVNLTASGAGVGGTYSWSPAGGLSATNLATVNASPPSTETYTITGTDANGCEGTGAVTVTVTPLPTISISPAAPTICPGTTVDLTASGATSFLWDNTSGELSGTVGATVTASPPAIAGAYTYSVTGTTGSCSATTTVTVTVSATLNVIITPPASTTICAGETTTNITASGATTYSWDNAGELSSPNSAITTATPPVTRTYIVTGTAPGCGSDTASITITVNPRPVVTVSPDVAICSGGSTVLTAAGAATYTWSPSAGLSDTTGASVTADSTITATYTVTGTTALGCTNTASVVVSVNSNPTASPGGTREVCIGSCKNIGPTINVSGGTGAGTYTYSWDNAGDLDNPAILNPSACPAAPTTYTLTVTDANGCKATTTSRLNMLPLPTITANPATVIICAGTQTTITAGGAGASGTYSWNPTSDLSNPNGADSMSVTATPLLPVTYTVTGTTGQGCSNTATSVFTVNARPNVSVNPNPANICTGNSVMLTANGAVSYVWSPGTDLDNPNIANPTADPAATTSYTVIGTDGNGCKDTVDVPVNVTTSPVISVVPVSATLCLGDSTDITVSGATTYDWLPNDGSLSAQTGATVKAKPLATTTYTVTGSSAGCLSTSSLNIPVTVNPLPVISVLPAAPAICLGGAVSLTASGAVSYSWSPAAGLDATNTATVNANPIVTTVYTVTGTDVNGCENTTTVTVTVNSLPSVDAGGDKNLCSGSSVVIGNLATGGTGAGTYTYSWNPATNLDDPASATPTASPTITTTYNVLVTDANSCTATSSATITIDALPTVNAGNDVNLCIGSATTLGGAPTASGGTGAGTYTIAWIPPTDLSATNVANPVMTATTIGTITYTVNVTDANNCMGTDNVDVVVGNTAPVTVTPDVTVCENAPTTLTAGGADTYSWDPATGLGGVTTGATVTATLTATETYTITGTLAGCPNPGTATVTVTINTLPTITINPASATICSGDSVSLTASGANTYDWAPSAGSLSSGTGTTVVAKPVVPTTYTVTGTDLSNCSNSTTVAIAVNSLPTASAGSDKIICNQDTINIGGAPTADLGTGAGTYTYSWSPPGSVVGSAAVANPSVAPSSTTPYTVEVTDANNCKATATVNVTVNALPVVDAGNDANVCTGTPFTIGGAPTMSGTAPFTIGWSPATDLGSTIAANPILTATTPGIKTYRVSVTDGNGCISTDNIIITVTTTPVVTVSSNTILCSGTTDTLIASGATTYAWSPVTGLNTTTGDTVIASPPGTTTYVVTGTTGSCSDTASVTITANPALTTNAGSNATICAGDSLTIGGAPTITGGTGPYTYSWTPALGLSAGNVSNPVARPTLTTTYTLTATDASGCTGTASVTITVNDPPIADAGNDALICFGKSVTIGGAPAASGGGGSYVYTWSPGTNLTSISEDNPDATPAATRTYTLTVTDGNSCSASDAIVVTVNPALTLNMSSTPAKCGVSDGTASVNVSGGTSGYSYQWSPLPLPAGSVGSNGPALSIIPAGAYQVLVTDANGCKDSSSVGVNNPNAAIITIASSTNVTCNGTCDATATVTAVGNGPFAYSWNTIPAQTTANATGLCAGTYVVTVTDAQLCISTLNVPIGGPGAIDVSFTTINPKCNGGSNGSATATVTGGSGGYSYSWNTNPPQATATASNLKAGTYTLIVTDGNGCTDTTNVVINEPLPLNPVITAGANSCYGDCAASASVVVNGGMAPYTYLWGTSPGQISAATTPTLCTGTYTLRITDANDCRIDTNATITQPAQISFDLSVTDANCNTSNGSAAITIISGGVVPLAYLWTKGGEVTTSISNQPSGSYPFRVTDANGCYHDTIANINDIGGPIISSDTATNVSCTGQCDGTATVVATGTAPLTYTWINSAQVTATINGLCQDTYVATVTDGAGCKSSSSPLTVGAPSLTAVITVASPNCQGSCDGSASVVIAGGVFPYTYSWNTSPVQTTATAVGLCAGSYTVDVTDANGCVHTAAASTNISAPAALSLSMSQTNNTCAGANTGSATVTVSGGTGAYTYSWSPSGGNSSTASNLAAGKYIVTVTDGNSCSQIDSVTITAPSPLVANATLANAIKCNGVCDGSATVTVTGGTAPYSYSWNTPTVQITQTATALCARTYIVSITDGGFCSTTDTLIITAPAALVVSATSTEAQCGAATGSATAAVSGGIPPYKYAWTPALAGGTGDNTDTYSTIPAGAYSVLVTDNNGCTKSTSVGVNNPNGPIVNSLSSTNAKCNGDCNGTAAMSATGNGPFTYAWAPPVSAVTAAVTNLCAGTYTIAVTDAKACVGTQSVTITEPAPLVIAMTTTNVTCNGNADGTATATVSGGSGPYTYSWDTAPAQTTADATGLAAGTYTVTVTDINGCTATSTATITQLGAIIVSTSGSSSALCNGDCNNTLTATASGGNAPYSYSWNTLPVPQVTATATSLCAGTYIATVTDASGCTATATTTITQPDAISLRMITTDATCQVANGTAKVVVDSGGVAPYTYDWGGSLGTNDSIGGLPANAYTVIVRDSNGCSATGIANISDTNGPDFTVTRTSPTCPDGSNGTATATVITAGTGPYTIFWSSDPVKDTATATGLSAGIYTVVVTDAAGCKSSRSDTIVDPTRIDIFTTTKNVSCNGGNDGSATATATNGIAPYTYNWSKAGSPAGPTVSSLTEGTYTINVTDKNGCTATNSIVITSPNPLTIATSQTNVTCFGGNDGTATASASSGTAPYNYSWSPAGGAGNAAFGLIANTVYTVAATDAKGCIVTKDITLTQPPAIVPVLTEVTSITCNAKCDGSLSVSASGGSGIYTYSWNTIPEQTTQSAVGLCSGTYTVTAKDAAGCTSIGTRNIAEPLPLTLTVSSTVAQCAASDGTASVAVTGGKPGYTYAWSANPAIPVQNTATATGLAAGAYMVTVKDTNGCTASTNTGVNNPNGPAITLVSSSNINCSGAFCDGKATISASGGNTPFTYLWTNGQTSPAATNLCANPVVIVTDKAGCKATLTVPLTAPTPIRIDLSFTDITCNNGNNGTATATVSGGTAPYTYLWSNGQTSAKATNLAAGSYDLIITDANKCTQTSAKVTIKNPAAVSATLTVNGTIQCYGQCNSSITTVVSGGLAPYTYVWDTNPIQFTPTATGLCAGTYTVKITDANDCQITKSTVIAQPADMLLSLTHTDIACNVATGSASVTIVSGGSLPPTYLWSTGDTSASISNKPAGNYTIEVTDLNGCKKNTTVGIDNVGGPDPTATSTDATCIGSCNGTATVTVSSGTSPYSYSWNDPAGQTTPTATLLCAGTYVVTVTDTNGCIGVGNPVNVTKPSITVSANPTTGCQGTVVALTGTGPATGISWSSTLLPKGIFSPATAINSAYTTNSAGSDTLTMSWQSADASCPVYTKSFVINITATPVANPVLPVGMNCQNVPVTLTGSTSSGGVIAWSATNPGGPTGSFSNISIAAPTYTPSAGESGTTTLTMTVDNGICKTTNTVNIVWTPDVVPVAGLDKTICINEALQLNPTITGSVTGIIWSTSGDGTFSPNNTTASAIYTHGTTDLANASVVLSITTTGGCGSKTGSMTVSIKPSAAISAGPDQTIVLGKSAQLKGAIIGASSVVWSTKGCGTLSSATSLTPIYTPCPEDRKDTIIFYITSNDGCKTVIDSMYLKIREINFVDVFTPYPTSPGYNDVFVLPNLPDNARLVVFNRWGLKVFEAENYKNDWDGEGLPSDTYYYNLEVPGVPTSQGFVTIFRED